MFGRRQPLVALRRADVEQAQRLVGLRSIVCAVFGNQFRDELEGSPGYGRGTVAMANAGPNTNGSQFFICHGDAGLPHAYSVFGSVTSGMDAVDAIAGTDTDSGDKPKQECVINSVSITESE